MTEIVQVTKLPNKLPWIEGVDYDVIPGIPSYGVPVRIRPKPGQVLDEGFQMNTEPGSAIGPFPNTPNNPYFGKKALATKDFYALVGNVLPADRFKRLLTDSHFLWVGKVVDHVDSVDPDDKAGQFLQIMTYLTGTNGDDGKALLDQAEQNAIMTAWK